MGTCLRPHVEWPLKLPGTQPPVNHFQLLADFGSSTPPPTSPSSRVVSAQSPDTSFRPGCKGCLRSQGHSLGAHAVSTLETGVQAHLEELREHHQVTHLCVEVLGNKCFGMRAKTACSGRRQLWGQGGWLHLCLSLKQRVSVMKGLQVRVPGSSCCVRSGEDERRCPSAATAETHTFI